MGLLEDMACAILFSRFCKNVGHCFGALVRGFTMSQPFFANFWLWALNLVTSWCQTGIARSGNAVASNASFTGFWNSPCWIDGHRVQNLCLEPLHVSWKLYSSCGWFSSSKSHHNGLESNWISGMSWGTAPDPWPRCCRRDPPNHHRPWQEALERPANPHDSRPRVTKPFKKDRP